jgi:hypothetical protein
MDKEFQWYGKAMQDVIRRFSLAFPSADILVASSADCSFKYQGEYGSAIGVKPLVRVQAEAAFNSCVAFFNLFETMGGTNSMLDWIARKPPMANKDYVHVNSLGAAWLGEALFRAISHDYLLFKRSYPKGATPDTLSP